MVIQIVLPFRQWWNIRSDMSTRHDRWKKTAKTCPTQFLLHHILAIFGMISSQQFQVKLVCFLLVGMRHSSFSSQFCCIVKWQHHFTVIFCHLCFGRFLFVGEYCILFWKIAGPLANIFQRSWTHHLVDVMYLDSLAFQSICFLLATIFFPVSKSASPIRRRKIGHQE